MPQDIVRQRVINTLHDALRQAKRQGQLKAESLPTLTLDDPKRPEWGDLASTVAMNLAQSEGRPPHEVAQVILDHMMQREVIFDRVEIARPGFLNMTVKPTLWLKVLEQIEEEGEAYGRPDLGKGGRVLVEYVSANPTGPLHVGHGRGAAVGQAIVRLLTAAGYDVVSEYYINDAGRQMKLLGASVWARYQQLLGRQVSFPEDGYRGTYLEAVASHVQERAGAALLDQLPEQAEQQCQALAYEELLDLIKQDLGSFGIVFDGWFSESSLLAEGSVEHALDELRERKLLFEEAGAWWFRSSGFGDEKDRVVRKQDGAYTYLAADIAYHRDKLRRGYDLLIDVWGADHHGYIPRMEAVMQAYGHPKDRLRVMLVQMVNLTRGGQKVEMSKRTGEFVTLRELMDEVGADAAKFFFLMRRSDSHFDFDLELAKQRSTDNPMYYVQYAHARVASLCRVARERGIPVPGARATDLTVLTHPDELALIRKMSAYPTVLEASTVALEPHRITFYLQELAALLHQFYYKHRILPIAEVGDQREDEVTDEADSASTRMSEPLTPALTAARLVLMQQVQRVIRNGLGILGVTAPDRM
ncbi:MAG: arginine--tRNA ligase [Nitrospirales bacterium]